MRTLTKLNAGDLLLRGIADRLKDVKREYKSLPDWQKPDGWAVTEEMRAAREDNFVRWLPSSFFQDGLTPHERNIAGEAIRELEKDGFVEADAALCMSEMGSVGRDASHSVTSEAISTWNPEAIFTLGIT